MQSVNMDLQIETRVQESLYAQSQAGSGQKLKVSEKEEQIAAMQRQMRRWS